jgi:parallel beta-helix repeat protein
MTILKLKSGLFIFLITFSTFFMITHPLLNTVKDREENLPFEGPEELRALTEWTAEIELSITTTEDAQHPAIAVSREGDVHVVWADDSDIFGDSAWDIIYRRWDASSSTWTSPTLISTISTSNAAYPDIALDGEGNAHVVWHDYTNILGAGSYYDIFYRMWNKTTDSWQGHTGTYDLVTSGHYYSCQYPAIALDSLGNIHVVWTDDNDNASLGDVDTAYDIYYKCWNATTKLWDASMQLVSSESTSTAQNARIATDSRGNVHVAWEDYTNYGGAGSYYDIFYKHWNATTGLWSGYNTATDVISVDSTSYAYRPSIAVDGDDNVHIAWYDQTNVYNAGSDYDIFYRMWNTTTQVWSGHMNNTDVVTQTPYSSYQPAIGVDEFGNIHVAWRQLDNYGDEFIAYTMWDKSTRSWGTAEELCYDSWREIAYPDIAVHPAGDSHVVWHFDDYDYEIHYTKSIVSPPVPPTLQPITPNPNPNQDNELDWSGWMGATRYYIYRNTSYIDSIAGLNPVGVTSITSYSDVVATNGTYYYVIVAENSIGNSSISNCEGVNVSLSGALDRVRISDNTHFAVYGFPGDGTEGTPWIIEDLYIYGDGLDGIRIFNTTAYFIIRNCTFVDCNYGIYLLGATNGQLINNTARSGVSGFYLCDSDGNTLINNTANDNTNPSDTGFGFGLYESDNNWFEGNRAYHNNGGAMYGGVGFWLHGSSSNNLIDNYMYSNLGTGIIFEAFSDLNNLTRNQIHSNTGTIGYDRIGIAFPYDGGHYNRFVENNIYNHTDRGIESSHCGPNIFINNTIHHNHYGLYAVSTIDPYWQFSYNQFHDNYYGLSAWFSTATFYKNEFWNNTNGLVIAAGGGSILIDNTAWNNTNLGISAGANDMQLYNNTAYNNGYGISCSDWRIVADGNYAYNNTNYGFYCAYSVQFTNNFASGNDIGLSIGSTWSTYSNIESNTIRDNREGIHMASTVNITVKDNDIFNNSQYGIYIDGSNNSVITTNEIFNSTEAIHMLNTRNTTITSNVIYNSSQYGMYLENTYDTTIESNDILNCTHSGMYLLDSNLSSIRYNEIYNCTQYGIYLENCNFTTIRWNQILDNGKWFEVVGGDNETIVIEKNFCVDGPVLNPITPNPSLDGWVILDWSDLSWATYYLVYRSIWPFDDIWDIIFWGTFVKNVTLSNAVDNEVPTLDEYYYVIVAGNATIWSMWSNNQAVNITGYPIPGTPMLDPIVPPIDYNGVIELSWSTAQNATFYYIYRETSEITDITGLTPIKVISETYTTDELFVNGTYHYAVVAANNGHNGSVSNSVNVTIERLPVPLTPVLTAPSEVYDGVVTVDWPTDVNTFQYYVYRDTSVITDLVGRTPLAVVTDSEFTESIGINVTYHYVVLAGNVGFNSSLSNCVNVTVILYPPPTSTPVLGPIFPTTNYDGVIQLNWTDVGNVLRYYVYRGNWTEIQDLSGLTPITSVTQSEYTDIIVVNGTFYYRVVASNPSHNSSGSNWVSVTVALYQVPLAPLLYAIVPAIDNDGVIQLNWTDSASTSKYYIYRDTSAIFDISGLTPIASATQSEYVDTIPVNGTYWYVIVSGNPGHNSSISNCVSVNVEIIPLPGVPTLNPISPSIDYDGIVQLDWTETPFADYYYVYRDTSTIPNGTTLTPIAVVTDSNYSDTVTMNGTLFYAVVAAKVGYNGSVSNSESVEIILYPPPGTPSLNPFIPNVTIYGIISLNWTGTTNTTNYYVYKDTAPISDVGSLIPIANVTLSEYTDVEFTDGLYYFAIVAGNPTQNGTLSNCENITVYLYNPPSTPELDPITPSVDFDGVITLNWTDTVNATCYYVYRNASVISDVSALSPIANVTLSTYTDVIEVSGTYYYVIVAGNSKYNSSSSNCENVTVVKYWPVGTPSLDLILPRTDYDGVILLDWDDAGNATHYYVYRDTTSIANIIGLSPRMVTDSNFTDFVTVDGIYYYVVVAGNLGYNGSLSNCENVTVEKYWPVTTPSLNVITPRTDYDGVIQLDWDDTVNATMYYIYRNTSYIADISGLSPTIALVSSFTDYLFSDGAFYYVIIAGNPAYNGSLSNCENVTVEKYWPVATPSLDLILPRLDYDGVIQLDWDDVENATVYYIYWDTAPITNTVAGLSPTMVTDSNLTDYKFIDGTYYYVIVAGNLGYNGSLSNCENVTVDKMYPVAPATLNPIIPGTDTDGIIHLDWPNRQNATHYYLYKYISDVIPISSLEPLAVVSGQLNYTDYCYMNGTFYYAIIAGNVLFNSTISSSEGVIVRLAPVKEGWGRPEVISPTENDSYTPQIALDEWGNLHVIWEDTMVYRMWNVSSGEWTSMTLLSTESGSNASAPEIIVDSSGNIHCIWVGSSSYGGSGSDADIFYRYMDGTTRIWNTTIVVSAESGSPSFAPTMAVDLEGNVHVAWYEYNGTNYYIYYKMFNAALSAWGSSVIVSDIIPGDSIDPTIAVDTNGKIHLAWSAVSAYGGSGADSDIFYRLGNTTAGTWGAIQVVSTQSVADSIQPTLAVDREGGVFLAWADESDYAGAGTDFDIFFKFRNTAGMWSGFVSTTDVISTESMRDSFNPSIAASSQEYVHIVWHDFTDLNGNGNDADIFYKSWNKTRGSWYGSLDNTDVVSAESTGNSTHPAITLDGEGGIFVVWQDETNLGYGSDWDIFYKAFLTAEEEEETGDGGFPLWIIFVIAAAAVAMAFVMRSRSRTAQTAPLKPSKFDLREVGKRLRDASSIEEKIRVLHDGAVPLEIIGSLDDEDVISYFNQQFASLPIQLIEFLQRLDAPLEDKAEIIAEFNNLSTAQKKEFLNELSEFN